MAERRMFTKKITDDDNFMSLSASAQALYLHLSMSADDDGFCNQVSASMFKAHASIQDLEALLSKRYVYQFENGVIVIKHWRMANALRKDRYTPTAFQEELKQLRIKENGAYTLEEGSSVADWLPSGCRLVATDKDRIGKDSLGEDSLGKDSIGKVNSEGEKRKRFIPPTLEEVKAYVKERNSSVDPKRFFEYYETGKWKDAKGQPVRNWKQKLITWEKKDKPNKFCDHPQSDTDLEDLEKRIFAN